MCLERTLFVYRDRKYNSILYEHQCFSSIAIRSVCVCPPNLQEGLCSKNFRNTSFLIHPVIWGTNISILLWFMSGKKLKINFNQWNIFGFITFNLPFMFVKVNLVSVSFFLKPCFLIHSIEISLKSVTNVSYCWTGNSPHSWFL